jgi:hypothetical protein
MFAHLAGTVEAKNVAKTIRVAKIAEECLALQFRQRFIRIIKFSHCHQQGTVIGVFQSIAIT